jgi:RNA polymerase sigma-70 factor (ECF subfamily)
MDDAEAVERARGGDEAAFLEIYRRYRDPVFRFAWRMTGAEDAAADIAHDCWLAVLDGRARWRPGRGALLPFLLGVARNMARRRLRYEARESGEEAAGDAPALEDPLREVLAGEIGEAVARAMRELPPLQREAVALIEFEGMNLEETAAAAGVDVGTLKARLYRARQTLRRKLQAMRA